MLRCGAAGRAWLPTTVRERGAGATSKYNLASITQSPSQLHFRPHARLPGQALVPWRAFATGTTARAQTPKSKTSLSARGVTRRKTAATKKAAPKKAATKKKKKPVKKAKKPAPKKKKVVSEKAKAAADKKKSLLALRELKATALTEPKRQPDSAWTVYVAEKLQGKGGNVTQGIKSAAADYKSLSASEREHFNHIANQNKEANQKAYTAWVNSHTPLQILTANVARQALKRKAMQNKERKSAPRSLSPIKDDRQVKRPQSAFFKFNVDRREGGDFQGIALGDSAKLITKEWAELSAGEKKKYEDLHLADKERYLREYERTYGKPSPSAAKVSP